MTIPTQMRLAGFIASVPQLTFTCNGVARFYARIGVEHARKETDGTFTSIEPTFHDLVLYRASAERALPCSGRATPSSPPATCTNTNNRVKAARPSSRTGAFACATSYGTQSLSR